MRDAPEPMDENIELFHAVRELRAKKDVVFLGFGAKKRLIIAAQISLQAEPVIQVASESGLKSAAVGERIAVKKRVANKHIAGRAFMAHVAGLLCPAANREK